MRSNRWCAAILLAVVALSVLHSAAFHHSLHRDCLTCQTLQASSMDRAACGLTLPPLSSSSVAQEYTDSLPPTRVLRLRPLRAPPLSPAI